MGIRNLQEKLKKKILQSSKNVYIFDFSVFGNPFHSCKKQMCTGYIFFEKKMVAKFIMTRIPIGKAYEVAL